MNRNRVICITGNIASGKTTVSKHISALGYTVIDADIISKQIVEQGEEAYIELIANFGIEILDSDRNLDRKKLSNIIYNDYSKLKLLNRIMHPIIEKNMVSQTLEALEKNKIVFLDIPLFFEKEEELRNMGIKIDEVWLVYIEDTLQEERLMKRDAIDINDARKKIKAQMDPKHKIQKADVVIENNDTIEILFKKIEKHINKALAED